MFIRYIMNSTLKIQIATYTTIALCSWTTVAGVSQGIAASILLLAYVSCPIFFALVLWANFENLDKELIQNKIGSMYTHVDLEDRQTYGLALNIVFLIRRTIFVVITFALYDHPSLQILLFIWTSVLYIAYLGHSRVYQDQLTLRLEYLNEGTFLVICYHLISFTNILDNPSTISIIGWSLIIAILFLTLTNSFIMVFSSLKDAKLKCAARRLMKSRKTQLKKAQASFSLDLDGEMSS